MFSFCGEGILQEVTATAEATAADLKVLHSAVRPACKTRAAIQVGDRRTRRRTRVEEDEEEDEAEDDEEEDDDDEHDDDDDDEYHDEEEKKNMAGHSRAEQLSIGRAVAAAAVAMAAITHWQLVSRFAAVAHLLVPTAPAP